LREKLQNFYVMKTEKKLSNLFAKKPELFPLGYQYLKEKEIVKISAKIETSKFHNSKFYEVGYFYKPTSILFSNE